MLKCKTACLSITELVLMQHVTELETFNNVNLCSTAQLKYQTTFSSPKINVNAS